MQQKSFLRFLGFQPENLKPVLSQVEASKTCPGLRGTIQRHPGFVPTIENLKSKIQNRMAGLLALVVAFAVCGAGADAQQAGKIFRIGYLDPSYASGSAVLLEAFRQELSKLGWIEGKNITIEYRFAEQKTERLPELAADLVRLKVDLIVVTGRTVGVSGQERHHYHSHRDGDRSRTPWVQVWLPVWRGREAMSRGSRVYRPS